MVRRGLVCSGGGAKGSLELGMLSYLIEDKGLTFDVIAGTSVGALNGSMIAQDDFELLKKLWFDLKGNKDIYKKRFLYPLRLPWINSIYDFSPLESKINQYVDGNEIIKLGKKLFVGVGELCDGSCRYVTETDAELKKAIYASASMPFFASPVALNNILCVDGGVVDVAPLKPVIKAEVDEIYVVLASPLKMDIKTKYKNVVDISLRSFEIIMNEIYRNDIALCNRLNNMIRTFGNFGSYKDIPVYVIDPEKHIMGTLEFDPEKIRIAFAYGRERAKEILK